MKNRQRIFPFMVSPNSKNRIVRQKSARCKGTHTESEWESLKAHYGYRCLACWKKVRLTKDHVEALYLGGSDAIDNLQPLCRPCNSARGGMGIDFRPLRSSSDGWVSTTRAMPAIKHEVLGLFRNGRIDVAWVRESPCGVPEDWGVRTRKIHCVELDDIVSWREIA